MDGNMMMQAMQALQQMQAKMGEAQEMLKGMTVTEVGGDGMVRATVTGELRLSGLEIDMAKIAAEEKEVAEDLIVTTVNKALESAEKMKEQQLGAATSGLMPNIPGLGAMFGGGQGS